MKKLISVQQGLILIETNNDSILGQWVYDNGSIYIAEQYIGDNQELIIAANFTPKTNKQFIPDLPTILTTESEIREMIKDREIEKLADLLLQPYSEPVLYLRNKEHIIKGYKSNPCKWTDEQMKQAIELALQRIDDYTYKTYDIKEILNQLLPPIDCECEIEEVRKAENNLSSKIGTIIGYKITKIV